MLVALCALATAVVLLPVASSAETVEDVRAERARIQARLDEAARDLADSEERSARLEARRDELAADVAAHEEMLAEIDERTVERVRQVYMRGSTVEPIAVFLASEDPDRALDRAGTVRRLVHGDRVDAEEVRASRAQMRADLERLDAVDEDLSEELATHRQRAAELERDLDRARTLERRLEREAAERRARQEQRREREQERQRAADRSTASSPSPSGGGGMACPVDQPRSFTDTWGAPRSGGRSHRGTDLMAAHGAPAYAVVSGRVRTSNSSAGGISLYLDGDNGETYFYAHNSANLVSSGQRVGAGDLIARVGSSGNASAGAPHVHFERVVGGRAVNPYDFLRRIC